MQRALTPLALDPQIRIVLLVDAHFLFAFDVDLLFLQLALVTDNFILMREDVLTPKAGLLNHSELAQS